MTCAADVVPPGPASLDELMAYAIAMEREAAARYDELGDVMETHNNVAVAQLFRTMADIERRHAAQLLDQMSWSEAPELTPSSWSTGPEAPESVASGEVHYLMQPYHALTLAHASERRAAEFFRKLADSTARREVRRAALALAAEELEHVALVEQWLAKAAPPTPDWAEDPDPPRYSD